MKARETFAILCIACAAAAVHAAPPDPVLARFIGTWKTEARIRNFAPSPREVRATGRGEARATLENRYVEFRTSSIEPPGVAELQVMTYDAEEGVYRQWVFDSDGYRHATRGRWNAATSTLTWDGEANGAKLVIDDHWVSPDRLEWTLTRTAPDGRVLQRIEGVVARHAD